MAKTTRVRGVWSLVGLVGVCLAIGCSNPHQQTIELPDSAHHDDFEAAMKKLPLDEKNLVNDYIARRTSEGVRPVGITIEEAIREQRAYQASPLADKLIDGAVRVAQALNGRPVATTVVVLPQAVPGLPPTVVPTPPTVVQPPTLPALPPTVAPAVPTLAPTQDTRATPPVAPTPTASPSGVASPADMQALLQQIDALPFPSQKASFLKDRAPLLTLTTRQAIGLARTLPFPDMQVEVLSALYPRIVDRQNFAEAYSLFVFDGDREALRSRVAAMTGQ